MKREDFINVAEKALDSLPGISQPYKERRDSGRGFSAEPVTTPAGAETAIASRYLSRRPSNQEERL